MYRSTYLDYLADRDTQQSYQSNKRYPCDQDIRLDDVELYGFDRSDVVEDDSWRELERFLEGGKIWK